MKPKNCPLCVNIQRLELYLLAPDEVIFFDWLVIKQSIVFQFKPFYYQSERIEKETRIKRRCLERIIKRFTAMGILFTDIRAKPNGVGCARYFNLSFTQILNRLPEIIDCESDAMKEFETYFSELKQSALNAYDKTYICRES